MKHSLTILYSLLVFGAFAHGQEPPLSFTVSYDGNGSTGGSVPVDANSPYTDGSTAPVLGNTGSLVRSSYTFNGWNTAASSLPTTRDISQ